MKVIKFIVVTLIASLVCTTHVNAATLYESPKLDHEIDMVFSIANEEVNDQTTNGILYDGKPYGLFQQIHEDVNQSGNVNRYVIHNVSGSAISMGINQYLKTEDARNINEQYLSQNDIVENILINYADIDFEYVCQITSNYIATRNNLNLLDYNKLWAIDFYVLKTQNEGDYGRIHVDGKVVFYEIEEPIEEEPTPIEEEPTPEEDEPIPIEEEPIIEDDPVVEEVEETPTPSPIVRIILPPIIISTPTPTPTVVPTPTPTPELTATPVPTEVPTPTPVEEEVEVDVVETPEGTPEEEVEVDEPETPEGAPDEEVEVDVPDVPESLPQTGVTDSKVFYGLGAWMIALGVILIRRRKALL